MVSWVQRGGPLAEFADGYRDELVCRGFTANSVVTHVVLMGQLSRWMAEVRVAVGALTPARIDEFLDSRRAGGQRRVPTARVLDPLLAHLRAAGVVGPPLAGPATPLGDLLECYERHLVEDRGLAASTVVGYVGVARRFLSERTSAAGDETGVAGLCAGVVTAFLLRECGRLAVGSAKNRLAACAPPHPATSARRSGRSASPKQRVPYRPTSAYSAIGNPAACCVCSRNVIGTRPEKPHR